MAALALILGVLALAGWSLAAGYRWTLSSCRLELEEMRVSIHVLEVQLGIAERCLREAEITLVWWERAADAEPPLTEIPAAFRQAFGEGE